MCATALWTIAPPALHSAVCTYRERVTEPCYREFPSLILSYGCSCLTQPIIILCSILFGLGLVLGLLNRLNIKCSYLYTIWWATVLVNLRVWIVQNKGGFVQNDMEIALRDKLCLIPKKSLTSLIFVLSLNTIIFVWH